MPVSGSQDDRKTGRRIDRRKFVKAAGISGITIGIAGCTGGDGGGGGGDDETAAQVDTKTPQGDVTVKFVADSNFANNNDKLNQSLHKAGLPDNITVNFIDAGAIADDRRQKFQQWLSAGRAEPAILMMDSGWTIPFIARNQILNLSEALPKDIVNTVKNKYFEASVRTATGSEGDLHAIPIFPDFPTMQYRKDLVKEAGYDPEGQNWATKGISWKRFSKVTKDVKNQSDVQMGFTFQADVYEGLACCDFNEFMTSWGGSYFGKLKNLFGPIGDRPITVDEKPVIDSIRMVRTFINGQSDPKSLEGYKGGISPNAVLQWTEETSRKPFTRGNAVMHRNWPYSININGAEDKFGKDLGVMPIPWGVKPENAKYEGTGGVTAALGGQHMAINPNSKKKSGALQVIQAMMKDQFQLDLFALVGFLPPKPKLFGSKKAQNVEIMGRYLDSLKVAGENAIPRPVTVVWPQQSGKISEQVNATFGQNKPPKKAMSSLKQKLEAIEQSA